jgi:hypothetical protein
MRFITLKYGTISGLLMAIVLFGAIPMQSKVGFQQLEMMGFIGTLLAFIPVFFGIRTYRETIGEGSVSFLRALNTGIIIVAIASIFYALSWLIIFYKISPDFIDKYRDYNLEQMKLAHASQKDMDGYMAQIEQFRNITKNPFMYGAYTFTEPLPQGVIITAICSLILRRKTPGAKPLQSLPNKLKSYLVISTFLTETISLSFRTLRI